MWIGPEKCDLVRSPVGMRRAARVEWMAASRGVIGLRVLKKGGLRYCGAVAPSGKITWQTAGASRWPSAWPDTRTPKTAGLYDRERMTSAFQRSPRLGFELSDAAIGNTIKECILPYAPTEIT